MLKLKSLFVSKSAIAFVIRAGVVLVTANLTFQAGEAQSATFDATLSGSFSVTAPNNNFTVNSSSATLPVTATYNGTGGIRLFNFNITIDQPNYPISNIRPSISINFNGGNPISESPSGSVGYNVIGNQTIIGYNFANLSNTQSFGPNTPDNPFYTANFVTTITDLTNKDVYMTSTSTNFKVSVVPTPSSALSTLAFGTFSAGYLLKRQLKKQN